MLQCLVSRGSRKNYQTWQSGGASQYWRMGASSTEAMETSQLVGDKKRRMVNALLLGSNFFLSLGLDEGATGDVRNLHPQAKPQGDCSAGLGRQHNCSQRGLHARTLFDKHADARRHDKTTTSHRELGHVNPPIEPRGFLLHQTSWRWTQRLCGKKNLQKQFLHGLAWRFAQVLNLLWISAKPQRVAL